MKVLSKRDVLLAKELKKELVDVPEWGGSIWVQEMTGEQRDRFDKWVSSQEDMGGFRVRIVLATAVDEEGKPMFTDLDIPDLNKRSGRAISRLSDKGMELSGMTEEVRQAEVKNFEAVPSEGSFSDSAES